MADIVDNWPWPAPERTERQLSTIVLNKIVAHCNFNVLSCSSVTSAIPTGVFVEHQRDVLAGELSRVLGGIDPLSSARGATAALWMLSECPLSRDFVRRKSCWCLLCVFWQCRGTFLVSKSR